MKIAIITPKGPASTSGNWTTADRWASLLRELGHEAIVSGSWEGEDAEFLIALHARRSHDSIARFAAAHPERPLVVALTGTDLYHDIHEDESAQKSLELAHRLVVLQERGPDELAPEHRAKTRVIYQSANTAPRRPAPEGFTVCVLGNLRAEKDPFRAALATSLLPETSGVRVLHAGSAEADSYAEAAMEHEQKIPRYRWLGPAEPAEALEFLGRAHALVQSSVMEGGANAVGEAIASGVPVLASDIPGNIGMLGGDYPGYYTAGDERALAALMRRAETDAAFYEELRLGVRDQAYLVSRERERDSLAALVEEFDRTRRQPRYTRRMSERERIRLTKYSTKAG